MQKRNLGVLCTCLLFAAVLLGLSACGNSTEDGVTECTLGYANCACTSEGTCLEGYTCKNALCVATDGDVENDSTSECVPGYADCTCATGSKCLTGYTCTNNKCVTAAVDGDPDSDSESEIPCTPGYAGCACTQDGKCLEGYACTNSVCTADTACTAGYAGCACATGDKCLTGYACKNNLCGADADSDSDSDVGCTLGYATCPCTTDGKCLEGYTCTSNTCVANPSCPCSDAVGQYCSSRNFRGFKGSDDSDSDSELPSCGELEIMRFAVSDGASACHYNVDLLFLNRQVVTVPIDSCDAMGTDIPLLLDVDWGSKYYIVPTCTIRLSPDMGTLTLHCTNIDDKNKNASFCQSVYKKDNCVERRCHDGIKNFDESDTDCGGEGCVPCADGKVCSKHSDCQEDHVCNGGVCKPAVCGDGFHVDGAGQECNDGNTVNGDGCDSTCHIENNYNCSDSDTENDDNYSRSICYIPCNPQTAPCPTNADKPCQSAVCENYRCAYSVQAAGEAPSGSVVSPDACHKWACNADGTASQVVDDTSVPVAEPCYESSCLEGVPSATAREVGASCTLPKKGRLYVCDVNHNCVECIDNTNCMNGYECANEVCTYIPTCTDTILNGSEVDVDCGGLACPACADGKACMDSDGCQSRVCLNHVCQVPTCQDGTRNGLETGADCGGGTCSACANGVACENNLDCQSGVCSLGMCLAPSCTDGVKNGTEIDTDCGGTCAACANGKACTQNTDCTYNYCHSNVCTMPACNDGVKNGSESAVDCGGTCSPCADLSTCNTGSDCLSGVCSPSGVCSAPACDDGVKNGTETAVDCGGTCGATCTSGTACTANGDCSTGYCNQTTLKCAVPACNDGVKNGTETGTDCGGSCGATCANGTACTADGDCLNGYCNLTTLKCATPGCGDNVKNGDETGVDCGGTCSPCADGGGCTKDGDCSNQYCNLTTHTCATPACNDGVKNGTETAVDCGGTCGATCANNSACMANGDCTNGYCNGGTCATAACDDGVKNGNETGVDCGGSCLLCDGDLCAVDSECHSMFCILGACMVSGK